MEEEEVNPDADTKEDADAGTINITTTTKVITKVETINSVKTTVTITMLIQNSKVVEITISHTTTRVLRELVGITMQTNPITDDNQIKRL